MKKRILACLLALVMLIGVLPVMALADNTVVRPEDLAAAVTAAKSGDTIYLGEGTFTLYGQDGIAGGKSLTFVGAGKDKTIWNIGTGEKDVYGQGNADFSLRGAKTVTFRNMTLKAGIINGNGEQVTRDYMGFAHTDVTVVEDCVIDGKTFYWGYTSATFTNTTFSCPPGDYAVWTYSSPTMTFDHCVFNSSGKVINVPSSGDGPKNLVVNYQDCIVNSSASIKSVFNVHDYGDWGNNKSPRTINISGHNEVYGLYPNRDTCSRLFQVEVLADNEKFAEKIEKGYGVTINFGSTTVWKNGAMVDDKTYHNSGVTANGVAYTNGVDGSNDSLYAEGYKDNVINVTPESDWAQQPDGSYERTVTRVCKYCGYTETVKEVKKDDIVDIIPVILPAISKNETAPKLNTRDHFAYVQGYPDGTVKPAGSITRAEVAAILFRLMDADSRSLYYSTASGFRDVDSTKWYNTYVATLNNAGVITDSRTGYFRPNDAITRAELAAMLAQFAEKKSAAIYFSDVSAGYWAANAIALTANLGWINGYPDGTFGPDKTVTRAELMAMVNRATGRAPESTSALLSGMKTWKDNADTARWYYLDVQEATNSHTYLGAPTETWTSLTATPDWSQYE